MIDTLACTVGKETDRQAEFVTWLPNALRPGFRLANAMLQDPEAAEDAVQEAAALAWRRCSNIRDGADPMPWFLGIVANQCRGRWRDRRLRPLSLEDADAEPSKGHRLDESVDIRRAVRHLNRDQRAVVLLHFYMDLPLEAVAEAVAAPLGTVKSRLGRALMVLRGSLRDEGAMR